MLGVLPALCLCLSASAVSAATETLVPSNSVWKYLDNGSDQGAAWRDAAFNDKAWASGPAQLGYGDGGEATVVSYGPDANNKYSSLKLANHCLSRGFRSNRWTWRPKHLGSALESNPKSLIT
jgi:hypothetical protein